MWLNQSFMWHYYFTTFVPFKLKVYIFVFIISKSELLFFSTLYLIQRRVYLYKQTDTKYIHFIVICGNTCIQKGFKFT